jgi:hypothetical protein
MTKQLTYFAAGFVMTAASLLAQTSNFQQNGWIRFPNAGAGIGMNTLEGQSGPVLNRPFSATEVRKSTQVLGDGTHVDKSEVSAFYRDVQGRMRSESQTQAAIYDPVAGFIYSLSLQQKTYNKNPVRGGQTTVAIAVAGNRTSISSHSSSGSVTTARKNGESTASATEELAPQTINGVYSRGSRVTTTIPAGTFGNDRDIKIVNERWYSDDLQVLVKSSNSDPRFGVTTYELTNITQAPPDPALFQIPADYRAIHQPE